MSLVQGLERENLCSSDVHLTEALCQGGCQVHIAIEELLATILLAVMGFPAILLQPYIQSHHIY